MDFPPSEWVIFQAADFDTMEPRNPGDWGMEVLAQIRSNGRISDHWRIALGGTKVVEATFQLSELLPAASQLPDWTVSYQMFPRDIVIRRNMVSSNWIDAMGLRQSHEMTVSDNAGEPVAIQHVMQAMEAVPAKQRTGASIRWSVTVLPSGKLELQLQALPASANTLGGKPIFSRCVFSFRETKYAVAQKYY